MTFTVPDIDRAIAELDQQYQRDRAALVATRDGIRQTEGLVARILGATSKSKPVAAIGGSLAGRISATRHGKKTDRAIIREFLAGWSGSFTVPDLIAAAERAGNKEVADIPQDVWSSTLYWLCQNGLTQVVEPRRGNLPGTYRVTVSREELLAPKRRPRKGAFSVQAIVVESLKAFPNKQFSKKELFEFVLVKHPEHKARLTSDVLGATLHRLAANEHGVRIAEQSNQGNTYEKL